MPIQYKDSIMDATKHCREHASLFDVSHMCGVTLKVRLAPVPIGFSTCAFLHVAYASQPLSAATFSHV